MIVYRSLASACGAFGPAALSIGNFDGTNLGHWKMFECVNACPGTSASPMTDWRSLWRRRTE
jgi:FAD synthase